MDAQVAYPYAEGCRREDPIWFHVGVCHPLLCGIQQERQGELPAAVGGLKVSAFEGKQDMRGASLSEGDVVFRASDFAEVPELRLLRAIDETPYFDWIDADGDIRTSLFYELTMFDYLTSTVKLGNAFEEPQLADLFRRKRRVQSNDKSDANGSVRA